MQTYIQFKSRQDIDFLISSLLSLSKKQLVSSSIQTIFLLTLFQTGIPVRSQTLGSKLTPCDPNPAVIPLTSALLWTLGDCLSKVTESAIVAALLSVLQLIPPTTLVENALAACLISSAECPQMVLWLTPGTPGTLMTNRLPLLL